MNETDETAPGLAPADTSDSTAQVWHTRQNMSLLKELAGCIEIVHEANPASWTLQGNRNGSIALNMWGLVTVSLWSNSGWVLLPCPRDDQRWLSIGGTPSKVSFPDDSVFRMEQLDRVKLQEFFRRFRGEIHDALRFLALRNDTATFSRNSEHRPDLVDALSALSEKTLPQPSHFEPEVVTRDGLHSNYWLLRQPSHPVVDWKNQHRHGYVRFVWPSPRVDLSSLPADPDGFTAALAASGVNHQAASRLYQFTHVMEVGDSFAVSDGPFGYTFAAGAITGSYQYVQDDPVYPHRRPVSVPDDFQTIWLGQQDDDVSRLRFGWGPLALKQDEYVAMITPAAREASSSDRNPPIENAPSATSQTLDALSRQFASSGLTYSNAQIATFYTALQTKGFVVLSGISGTGKSKIAQGFVVLLPTPQLASASGDVDPDRVITRQILPYMPKHKTVVIPTDKRHMFPPMSPNQSVNVDTSLNGVTAKARLFNEVHPGGNLVLNLYFKGPLRAEAQNLTPGDQLFIVPIADEEGEYLERIDLFTDIEKLPDHFTGGSATEPMKNSLFLSVRPDWRDSTSLLGYYNPLTETYEWTEFLRFLLRAADDYREHKQDALAWFVILDEMNLAHVEYYFADLLSIIESGRNDEGWSREPIRLTYPDSKTDNPPPHEILLPPNLYIIGTVNMDETTHAFSPKVLDRAFTIELTDVDFSAYPPDPSDSTGEVSEEERRSLLRAFTNGGTFAQVRKDDIRQAVQEHPEIRDWLQNLNSRLAVHQFHFGYRVFDEIAQFIYHADRNGMFDSSIAAFDHAVYMKVLPKFNGSHARLDGPLTALIDWAKDPSRLAGTSASSSDTVGIGEDENNDSPAITAPQLTRVLTRAQRMKELLEANGFVSFG